MAVRDLSHGLQVDGIGVGVAQGFAIYRLGSVSNGGLKIPGIRCVHKNGVDAEILQCIGKQRVRAAVQGGRGYDGITGAGDILDGVGDGRHAGGSGQRTHTALQGGDTTLEGIVGGVGQPGIDIARVGQTETACRLGGILEDV